MYITFIDKRNGEAITQSVSELTEKNSTSIDNVLPDIYRLYEEAQRILAEGDLSKRYRTEFKPKQSGGKRRIDKPDEELKKYMRDVNNVFVKKLNLVFPQASYAYIENRSPKQLAQAHRNARIIAKFDIKNFFNNCTLEFIMTAMQEVYPFCLMDTTVLEVIVKACMLKYDDHYGLPQGAPTSPILSNIAMIPIDYYFSNRYKNYARFADDIYISFKRGQYSFIYGRDTLEELSFYVGKWLNFKNKYFVLNHRKTQMVNIVKEGGVWVLGMVINKDHNITIGSKEKQILKAKIFSFLMDAKNGNPWERKEVYRLIGKISYYRHIEPQYVDMIIQKYQEKTGMNYHTEIENIIYS